jgi:hypothetical protein
MMNSIDVATRKRLSRMFFVFTALQVLVFVIATVAWTMLPWLGMLGRSETEANILMMVPLFGGWAFSAIAAMLFLPSLISGIAIGRGKEWGRVLGIITAILALLEIPLGTIFGIYALRRLRRASLRTGDSLQTPVPVRL